MLHEIDEIWRGCHDVATNVDEIGGDVWIWPLKLMRLEGMKQPQFMKLGRMS